MLKRFLSRLPLTDRITFAIEMWAAAFYGVFAGLALPLITVMARKIGISAEGIAIMTTMQFVGAIFGLYVGHLSDKMPKMPLYAWPTGAARAIIAFLALFHTPTGFFIVACLFYLLSNLTGPPYFSIMRSNYGDQNRSRLMSILRIEVMVIASVFSTLTALFLSNESVFKWLFPVAAVFGVLSTVTFARIKVRRIPGLPRRSAPVPFRTSLAVVGKNASFMVFMGLLMLCAGPDKLAIPIEPIKFVDELKIDYRQTQFILGTLVSVFSIIGYYLWAKTLKRSSPFAVVAVVTLLGAARTAVIAAATRVGHLVPASILLGLTNAGWDLAPLFCIITLADPENFLPLLRVLHHAGRHQGRGGPRHRHASLQHGRNERLRHFLDDLRLHGGGRNSPCLVHRETEEARGLRASAGKRVTGRSSRGRVAEKHVPVFKGAGAGQLQGNPFGNPLEHGLPLAQHNGIHDHLKLIHQAGCRCP